MIICTRNRALQLREVLVSLAAMSVPQGLRWELLIVDNGSTDKTVATVQSFVDRLPLRIVSQPVPGLSNARNAGISEAAGRYIVWTDDDVLVEPDWLAAYVRAFETWSDAVVFGGKIAPVLEQPTPAWFINSIGDLGDLLAARDFGDLPVPLSLTEHRLPFGASFAIRAAEQKQHLYDPDRGVAPGRRRGGEETQVMVTLLGAGHSGWWVPQAKVKHVIPASRQTKAYVRQFYEAMGEAWAYSMIQERVDPAFGAPIETWIKVALAWLRLWLARLFKPDTCVRSLTSFAYHYGALRYFLTFSGQRR